MKSTPPATSSCMPGAAPLLGTIATFIGSMPSLRNRPAVARCHDPPTPPPPDILNFVGSALIAAIASLPVFHGESVRTWKLAGSKL